MNSKGKWFLFRNEAASRNLYWNGSSWTHDAREALFFETLQDANNEAHHRANRTTTSEVCADQATRNIYES